MEGSRRTTSSTSRRPLADAPPRSRLASAWFYLVLFTTIPLIWLAGALTLLVTMPFDRRRLAIQRVVNFGLHQYVRCWPTWHVRITGREHLPAGPCVMIANHQSMIDVIALMGLGTPFHFVSKIELFSVPFIGWMMGWMRHIAIDRKRRDSMKNMLQECSKRLTDGEAVLIFPEGTYAAGPERLPFRRGAFHLAQQAQVPIVPIVIRGAAELVREDGPLFANRSHVHVEVMPPLAPPPHHELLGPFVQQAQRQYSEWLGLPFPAPSARPAKDEERLP